MAISINSVIKVIKPDIAKRCMHTTKHAVEYALSSTKPYALLAGASASRSYGTGYYVVRYAEGFDIAEESKGMKVRKLHGQETVIVKEGGHWKLYNTKTGKSTHTFSSSPEFPEGTPGFLLDPDEQMDGSPKPQYLIENQVITRIPSTGVTIDWEKTEKFRRKYLSNPEVQNFLKQASKKGKKDVILEYFPELKNKTKK